jgi:hypothetical protein
VTRNSINVVDLKSRLAELLPGEKVAYEFREGDESGIESDVLLKLVIGKRLEFLRGFLVRR